jgi:hypothetical protein
MGNSCTTHIQLSENKVKDRKLVDYLREEENRCEPRDFAARFHATTMQEDTIKHLIKYKTSHSKSSHAYSTWQSPFAKVDFHNVSDQFKELVLKNYGFTDVFVHKQFLYVCWPKTAAEMDACASTTNINCAAIPAPALAVTTASSSIAHISSPTAPDAAAEVEGVTNEGQLSNEGQSNK